MLCAHVLFCMFSRFIRIYLPSLKLFLYGDLFLRPQDIDVASMEPIRKLLRSLLDYYIIGEEEPLINNIWLLRVFEWFCAVKASTSC